MLRTEYYGAGQERQRYFQLALEKIPQSLRDEEAAAVQARWFDYRFMTPAEATYLFAAEYRSAYIEAFSRTKDIRKADTINPFMPDDIFASRELTAMYQARQAADTIGCKYDFYLRFAFKRFEHRGWRFFPRPNHLANEELVLDIADAWHTTCRASLQRAALPIFTAEQFDDLPEQIAYYEWVSGQVKQREHPYMALSSLVYTDGVMPESVAALHFDECTLRKAKNFASL